VGETPAIGHVEQEQSRVGQLRQLLDVIAVDHVAARIEEVDLHRPAALLGVGRPIQLNHRPAIAVAQHHQLVAELVSKVPGFELVEVPDAEVPLADAVKSYLFNAQLVTPPDGAMTLVAPTECRDTPSVASWIERHLASNGAIRRVNFVDVRQSMANGGGPACLRLRAVADPATVDPRFLVDDSRLDRIADIVRTHWPVEIANAELQRPALIRDIEAARGALLDALDLTALAELG